MVAHRMKEHSVRLKILLKPTNRYEAALADATKAMMGAKRVQVLTEVTAGIPQFRALRDATFALAEAVFDGEYPKELDSPQLPTVVFLDPTHQQLSLIGNVRKLIMFARSQRGEVDGHDLLSLTDGVRDAAVELLLA